MNARRGKFIVIEGTDGSGKSEQFKRLVSRLRRAGFRVATVDFPQYARPSSYFVREYLNGRYGSWQEVGPEKASLFYALDRFDVGERIKRWLKEGKVVVANRYVASNMGHQGAKLAERGKRLAFLKWVHELEYRFLKIPVPNCNIVLHMPARMAYALISSKGKREYLATRKRDIHEADIRHLKQAEKTYLEMVRLFEKDFRLVECILKGKLRSIEEIHGEVWNMVKEIVRKR